MRRLTAAFLLVFLGCSSSPDDGAQDDNASAGNSSSAAGNSSTTGGLSGSDGQGTGGSANGGAGANVIVGAGGAGGNQVTSGSGGSAGTGSKDGGAVAAGIAVTVAPKSTAVMTAKSLQLSATVTGSADTAVIWSVVESAGCGSVSATGSYVAPTAVPNPAFCHVKAVSHADAGKSDTATLNIVATGSTGQVGVWENVTPAGVSVDPNNPATNFGVMDVVADPVRPSDFYVGICYQGIWRSTDFGLTWKKVDTGANSAVVDGGRPWSMVIDNNKNRDPATAPTLYTTDGYGSKNGVLKSIDGGVNWTVTNINLGAYSFDMDPYDNQHLVTGLHEAEGIAESTDGGVVWKMLPTAIGKSIYPHFIDTGAAATTRKTWLAVPQLDTGMSGMMTTDGGATFHSVGNFAHPHGGNQAFNAGGGVAYVGASGGGVWRTTDSGATWSPITGSSDNGYKNGVIGTPGWLYSWDDGANAGGIGTPHLAKAPRNPGTAWTAVTVPTAFNNGGKTMATTFDGTHSVLVSGSWNAGIWRYVEP